MRQFMDYGKHGLTINVPDDADIFQVRHLEGFRDEVEAIKTALRFPIRSKPLKYFLESGTRVVITHTDITRATPNTRLLPVILSELETNGIQKENITLINALGTHRPQTKAELMQLIGTKIVNEYNCIQHNAFDDKQLVNVGIDQFGHPIRINKHLLEADLNIFTGFIEPHFFAGFSGGPKAVLPALAGAESVYFNHSFSMISNQNATFNVTEGNPIWEEMKAVSKMIHNTFLVNVTLNRTGQITGVFAGDVIDAHAVGIANVQKTSLQYIDGPYDDVITSNSGYPLDQNLYQCVKGLAAAKQAVRRGGAILLLAMCEKGLPEVSAYENLFKLSNSSSGLLTLFSQPGFVNQDAWQVQIQLEIQRHADCYVYSTGLSDVQINNCMLNPLHNLDIEIPELIARYGKKVCVLPEGPLMMLKLREI